MESQNEKTEITTKAHLQSCGLGLSFTRYAWTKLMAYCRATEKETSGFALLERDGDLLWVDEVYLLKQESTGTSTEMDRTDIAKFQLELYKAGVIGKKDSKKRLMHWHTHPTFSVFWSGTDMEMRRLNSRGVDYFVSIVVNQKGEALAAIDINGEFPLSINDLPIEIVDNQDTAELIKACKAEVELKVKSPTSTWGGGDVGYYTPGVGYGHRSSARKYWNDKTKQWEGDDEQFSLSGDEPSQTNHGNAKNCYCGAVGPVWISRAGCSACLPTAEPPLDFKPLGPGDRRLRKAKAKLERLSKAMAARAGKQSWDDWKKDQARLDDLRTQVMLAERESQKKDVLPSSAPTAAELDAISIVEGSEEDIVMSDHEGTYQNIAGEIVKTDEQVVWD